MTAKRSEQLPLALDHPPQLGREDLLDSPVLAAAIAIVDRWPDWPSPVVVLVGPPGSGKSHLAAIWAEASGAGAIRAEAGGDAADLAASGRFSWRMPTAPASTRRACSTRSTACANMERR